ncbi:MAG: tetratricopeptide repeat protein [Burkholderiales bacterium]
MAPGFLGAAATAYAADAATLRPEVGKPLQAAQDDIRKGKYKEALAKVHDAEAVSGKTSYETYMVDYLRAAAAQGAGDSELAAKSYEAVLNSGHATGAAQTKIVEALGELYYQAKDYSKAVVWLNRYLTEGGTDVHMRPLLVNAYYLNGEYAKAGKETQAAIQADENAGRAPTDEQLQMLVSCAVKLNDKAGELAALEKTLSYRPKKDLWVYLLNHLENKSGFAEGRLGLDVYRLKMKVGAVTATGDFMNMAELALQAGYPAEARKIIDAAFKSGAFGGGAEASRQKRLQDLATKKAADDLKTLAQTEAEVAKSKDGTGMVNVGYDYVTTGQFDKGIALMEQGIAKGGLKHPEDAKLHLALAYLQADKKSKALQTFKTVQGTDGTADLAHYWTIEINHPLN